MTVNTTPLLFKHPDRVWAELLSKANGHQTWWVELHFDASEDLDVIQVLKDAFLSKGYDKAGWPPTSPLPIFAKDHHSVVFHEVQVEFCKPGTGPMNSWTDAESIQYLAEMRTILADFGIKHQDRIIELADIPQV